MALTILMARNDTIRDSLNASSAFQMLEQGMIINRHIQII